MAPLWKPSSRSASRPCFAPFRFRVDPLIIFMPSFWNVVAGITSPASTAEIGSSPAMEGSPAGLCSRRGSPAHTHLHRRISNQRSRLRTPSGLSGWSTADRGLGPPRCVSGSTARVAHRANSVLPRGCSVSRAVSQQSSHARFAERPPDFQVTNPRSDSVQNDFF